MDEKDLQIKEAHVPQSVQRVIADGQLHKLAANHIGVETLSLEKIAQHIGTKLAEKRQRWRPVVDGLLALHHLRG